MLIAFAGLPGCGKSYFASQVVKRNKNYTVLDKDVVRSTLFPGKLTKFTSAQDDFCIDVILRTSAIIMANDPEINVIVDGRTFAHKSQVDNVIDFCRKNNIEFKFVEFICSEETAINRITAAKGEHLAKNRDADLYRSIKAKAEPLQTEHLTLATDDEDLLEKRLEAFFEYVR